MKNYCIITILSLAITVSTGCLATGGLDRAETTALIAEVAAKDATYFSLTSHPEWRDEFQIALAELNVMAEADRVDLSLLLSIISQLPIKQLEGKTAKVIISDVQIVIRRLKEGTGTVVTADNYLEAKLVVAAIRDGVQAGLEMTE